MRLWLEQDATCPTCRRKLNQDPVEDQEQATAENQAAAVVPQAPVWQFNLRRISRWLPSLQVVVNYDHQPPPMNENRLQAHANEILQVYNSLSLTLYLRINIRYFLKFHVPLSLKICVVPDRSA